MTDEQRSFYLLLCMTGRTQEAKCTNTAELQEELGVSRRTLRTDIAYLKRVYPDKLITHRGRYTGGLEWVE